jgi:hypothetical protein
MKVSLKRRATRPDGRQCAMLVAHLLETKRTEVMVDLTRARLSELTVRRLFGRQIITPAFLLEVQEWLYRAGWVMFFAGTSYAVITVKVVEGWGLISSKRIADDLDKVGKGQFHFDALEHLILRPESGGANED